MAHVQLMYGSYMAYVCYIYIYIYMWPINGLHMAIYGSVDSLLGGNFSVLVIKLDHEVGLRRYWYQFRAEFRAGSFYDGPEAIRGQFRA